MRGQRERAGATGGGAFLAPRRSEGDVGIDYSRAGGAIDGDRIDRKAVTLIERSKPGHQGIEGSRLQLHTYAAAARLRSLQGAAEARLAADAESLARSIADADGQAEALAGLATVASQAGEPERARRLMALALSLETREIGWLVGVVARLFPQVIKDAGDVFLNVYASSM